MIFSNSVLVAVFIVSSIFNIALGKGFSGKFNFSNFEDAKKQTNYLKFVVESTKIGLFTSDVPGYVKEFDIQGKIEGSQVTDVKIRLLAKSFDTDDDSRDEKLHDYCLEVKKYPLLEIFIPGPITIGNKYKNLSGKMNIRGKDKNVKLNLVVKRTLKELTAKGDAMLSLKKLDIPDPSIAVASLSDEIKTSFEVKLDIE